MDFLPLALQQLAGFERHSKLNVTREKRLRLGCVKICRPLSAVPERIRQRHPGALRAAVLPLRPGEPAAAVGVLGGPGERGRDGVRRPHQPHRDGLGRESADRGELV